jgi:hypothetical protein
MRILMILPQLWWAVVLLSTVLVVHLLPQEPLVELQRVRQ